MRARDFARDRARPARAARFAFLLGVAVATTALAGTASGTAFAGPAAAPQTAPATQPAEGPSVAIRDDLSRRLAQFAQYMRRRPSGSLATLVARDDRFRNTNTNQDAYAEAWALTYFLIRSRPDDYLKYLKHVSQKKPLVGDSPETRLAEFEAIFGDLEELDQDFLRYLQRIR